MTLQEYAQPGVYQDRDGNVWEKRPGGAWFVNGVLWNPFPDELMVLDSFRLAKLMERNDKEALLHVQEAIPVFDNKVWNKSTGEITDAKA